MMSGYILSCRHLVISNLFQIALFPQNVVYLCAPACTLICHPVLVPLLEGECVLFNTYQIYCEIKMLGFLYPVHTLDIRF